MIEDIRTIMWKEWKEITSDGGPRGRMGLLLFIAIFGIFLPWQMGTLWFEPAVALAIWIWAPLLMILPMIADSFAGERERHTLETLLASRLSGRAILLGKYSFAVVYGIGTSWVSLLMGLVTANLAYGQGKLLIYSPTIILGIIVLSLLSTGLATGCGILFSLRASSVRRAQQILSLISILLIFVPIYGIQALPMKWRALLSRFFLTLDKMNLIEVIAVIFFVCNVLLLVAAIAKTRRTKLIL